MSPKRKRIDFKILSPEARQVLLSGTFNQWSESSDPMKRDKTGTWKKVKMLLQGRYEYKFIIDGEWMLDPGTARFSSSVRLSMKPGSMQEDIADYPI